MEGNKTQSQPLNEALKRPNGARFYRCALQVNPFAYHGRHSKRTSFQNEADYNAAILAACKANRVEAIAITDHYRVADSKGLVEAARVARGPATWQTLEALSTGQKATSTTASSPKVLCQR
jgi:hypothetical protein